MILMCPNDFPFIVGKFCRQLSMRCIRSAKQVYCVMTSRLIETGRYIINNNSLNLLSGLLASSQSCLVTISEFIKNNISNWSSAKHLQIKKMKNIGFTKYWPITRHIRMWIFIRAMHSIIMWSKKNWPLREIVHVRIYKVTLNNVISLFSGIW